MLSDFSADFRTAAIGRVRHTNQSARLTALLELREDMTHDIDNLRTATADPACLALLEAQSMFLLTLDGMIRAAEDALREIAIRNGEIQRETILSFVQS